MKTLKINIKLLTLFLIVIMATNSFAGASGAFARIAPPRPPAENPHPPKTIEDKKRVAFAEMFIKKLLMKSIVVSDSSGNLVNDHSVRLNIDARCLARPNCISNNKELNKYISDIQKNFGLLTQYRHTHIIPWAFNKFQGSKNVKTSTPNVTSFRVVKHASAAMPAPMPMPRLINDEYMIHSYVKFDKAYGWHHLNVIVSEDENGNLEFRRFFIMHIPTAKLPPGVVC